MEEFFHTLGQNLSRDIGMLVYVTMATFSALIFLLMWLFGHDDAGGDMDHDMSGGHDEGGGTKGLSLKNLLLFVTGFGIAAAIARYYGADHPLATLIGLLGGLALGTLGFLFFKAIYRQQISTDVNTNKLVGQTAIVIVRISPGSVGEIRATLVDGRSHVLRARSRSTEVLRPESMVKITAIDGGEAIVELS